MEVLRASGVMMVGNPPGKGKRGMVDEQTGG
jgi:hypothetical protein